MAGPVWFDSIPVPGHVNGDEANRVWMPRIRVALLVGAWCLAGSVLGNEADWRQHRDAGLAAYRQGDYAEAVARTELALAGAEAFGERDTRFAETLANLAFLYCESGRIDDSERAFLRSVTTWEAILGEDHEIVGQTLNNLGSLYDAQGRFDEAEPVVDVAEIRGERPIGVLFDQGGGYSGLDAGVRERAVAVVAPDGFGVRARIVVVAPVCEK